MRMPQKLRSRISLYFCGYLAVLLALYSSALIGMLNISEDLAFNRQVSEIAHEISRHLEKNGKMPDYLPMHITAYMDIRNVPQDLKAFVTDRGPDVFEIDVKPFDYHVAIVSLPSAEQMLYVFYNVESLETSDQFESSMTLAVAVLAVGVFFLGWILARSLSNRILNPISELAGVVQSLSLDEDTVELRAFTTPDEVGTLAETIRQLLKRISEFTRREREFTAHASHELRTPVSVIKGAVEILRGRSNETDRPIRRPLARIERSATDMEMLIDTFLVLARQGKRPDKDETCDLKAIVEDVVASHQYLLAAKPVVAELRTADSGSIQAPPSLVTIALGNLVRNAFRYTMKGKVEIAAFADRIRVCDTGPGMGASRQSTGLGLTIVERVCETMNWQFVISGAPEGGTRAELIFTSEEALRTLSQNQQIEKVSEPSLVPTLRVGMPPGRLASPVSGAGRRAEAEDPSPRTAAGRRGRESSQPHSRADLS